MPTEHAKNALIKNLTRINEESKLQLHAEKIESICENIIQLFIEMKESVQIYDYLSTKVNSRIIWSPEYQQTVDKFKEKFLEITLPIGEISPGNLPNALWAGDEGIIAAKYFGHPTQKTLPVALIDLVLFDELKMEFFPNMDVEIKEKAIVCLYWSLLSSIYAGNIKGDVNLYLAENVIHSISYFWNFELPLIRKNNPNANIYVNVLKPDALMKLNKLKEAGEQIFFDKEDGEIFKLLTSADSWHKDTIENNLRLTSGSAEKHSVSYKYVCNVAIKWRKNLNREEQISETENNTSTDYRFVSK